MSKKKYGEQNYNSMEKGVISKKDVLLENQIVKTTKKK